MRILCLALKAALIVLLTGVAFELGSTYLIFLETKQLYHSPALVGQRKAAIAAHAAGVTTKLHPYYGFLQIYSEEAERSGGRTTNNYGFAQYTSQFGIPGCCTFPIDAEPRSDLFVIGLFSNSIGYAVADYFQAFPALLDRLKTLPQVRGKSPIVLNLAMGGHHQPQQLQILTNLLAIGMRFDVLLNLSTLQEIAGAADNIPRNVAMDYPTHATWLTMISLLEQRTDAGFLGLLSFGFERSAVGAQRLMEQCPIASCVMVLRPATAFMKRIASLFQDPSADARHQQLAHFFTARPSRPALSEEGRFAEAALQWQRSVELMKAVTDASGGVFLDTLLPNPWDHPSGSEPFLLRPESRQAVPPVARKSMAIMRNISSATARTGFPAFDATRILDDAPVNNTTYVDEHGHFGQAGLDAIAKFLLNRMEAALKAKVQEDK